MMDNRVFNVNGTGDDMLQRTLFLAFEQSGRNSLAKGWKQSVTHGLILLWYTEGVKDAVQFPSGLLPAEVCPIVLNWLHGDFAKTVALKDWDMNIDHDGHNGMGWRVYCEGWGHVDGEHAAICAITPAYMWYGK